MAWDHPRGVGALRAISAAYREIQPDTVIEWDARPLSSFEDTPVSELAEKYDLMAIDHPFIGDSVASDAIVSYNSLLTTEQLADRETDAVGPSHQSYAWQGHQWGLGIDAAAQVAAYDPAELQDSEIPRTWSELSDFSKSHGPHRIVVPANPTHLWGTLLSLCELTAVSDGQTLGTGNRHPDGRPGWWPRQGIDSEVLAGALQRLRELMSLCTADSFELNPIQVLDAMSAATKDPQAGCLYSPYVFGYITYSQNRAGHRPLKFLPSPSHDGHPVGTLTGGVGLVISAASGQKRAAADFAAFATSAEVQSGSFTDAGGQPGRKSAWLSHNVNEFTHDFANATFPSVGLGFLRARFTGFPTFQKSFSHYLHTAIREQAATGAILDSFTQHWNRHVSQNS